MKRILFVCSGNTGRSPMAEFVMKKLVDDAGLKKDFSISSAASKPTDGGSLHEGIAAKLREMKIPYTEHHARQITPQDYPECDVIACMDSGNVNQVREICGGDPDKKIKLLLEFAGESKDIPWDKNGFAETYNDILHGCRSLLKFTEGK